MGQGWAKGLTHIDGELTGFAQNTQQVKFTIFCEFQQNFVPFPVVFCAVQQGQESSLGPHILISTSLSHQARRHENLTSLSHLRSIELIECYATEPRQHFVQPSEKTEA